MHEMSYCIRLVNMANEAIGCDEPADGIASPKASDTRVESLLVSIGSMTGIVPDYLIKYCPEATKNTALEGAALNINMLPVIISCDGCHNRYTPSKDNSYRCPKCGSKSGALLQGREFILENITLRA